MHNNNFSYLDNLIIIKKTIIIIITTTATIAVFVVL